MANVTIDQMKDKLIPVDDLRETLSHSEPVTEVPFYLGGKDGPKFDLTAGWSNNSASMKPEDPVDAFVSLGDKEYRFTNEAIFEVSSSVGMTAKFMRQTPAHLTSPVLNYYFSQQPEREMKFLVDDDGLVLAYTRGTTTPFSNIVLLDKAEESIKAQYGDGQIYADYKVHHNFQHTAYRLIVPNDMRAVREDDMWSGGIQVVNSLIGKAQTSLRGYLFRWWCTNGAITQANESSHWSRKSGGQDANDVYEWAKTTIDSILGGMESEFEALDDLSHTSIHEEDLADTLRDVFERYRIPVRNRDAIVDNMVNSDDLTMYGVMQAITQAANGADVPEHTRELLMNVGGDIPRANEHRCGSCHRLM